MSADVLVAGAMLGALALYALSGGADFGAGVWDLLARGPRARRQRDLVARVIAPIWEANHVWLVLVVVLLFVCFPRAFAAIGTALHIPLALMLVGIVLRGSAFVLRAYGAQAARAAERWGRVFAISSALTPFFLGTTLGAVASGAMRFDPATHRVVTDFVSEWLAPFPLLLGAFTTALFAFLAAVYLTVEASEADLVEDFRRRALGAGFAVGVLAFATLASVGSSASPLASGLAGGGWALPFHLATGLAAVAALAALWRRRYRAARVFAVAQVSLVIAGFGASQYPYAVAPDLTLAAAAAPPEVLTAVLVALGAGLVLLLPAFAFLYRVFRRPDAADDGPPS